ncbi:UPF0481 protein At3g47200-like [Juglans microcarpa x Juglans regia]|uniref:UPF0481 protein At3g47200-like n=1 Tax=Juglans microcarpa x Juglans regia TaxID=2249226 RepID=UPI001B7E3F13|nr:UPF0481 protein At3g47200-like [Juglans microcarpa x Juglans regia]
MTSSDHYVSIDERLVNLMSIPIAPDCSVFEVHRPLRMVNEKAYEPDLLAIGPYHRGKDHLALMERHKLRLLQEMLKRENETSVERYIIAMRHIEERARKFYADQFPKISSNEFIEMMILDGCFILGLFHSMNEFDPIFKLDWMLPSIIRDLLLFENQLPFFVLTELYEISKESLNEQHDDDAHLESESHDQTLLIHGSRKHSMTQVESSTSSNKRESIPLLERALSFFSVNLLFKMNGSGSSHLSTTNIKHLLGLIHQTISPSPGEKESILNATDLQKVGVRHKMIEKLKHPFSLNNNEGRKLIPHATELQEAGVRFKKAEHGRNMFEIKFKNGILEIPHLEIVDRTESIFRNLIAYEQYSHNMHTRYVTDYVVLMDYLIYTTKDVKVLRQNGIIENWMGEDEVVSNMFNKLGHYVMLSRFGFYYSDIMKEVNKHCSKRRNVWMAKLRRDYFNSPWAWLSVLAAMILLLIAIAETTFSVLSYVQQR